MKLTPTAVEGAFLVEFEIHEDSRGHFTRTYCRREFENAGLASTLAQTSLSFNRERGILRGLHYQAAPHEEVKLVRCVTGAIYDVVLDLRAGSATYLHHAGVVLTARSGKALYVPAGCAHGFQVLEDGSEVLYHISEYFAPDHARGVRWNDPVFGIQWPIPDPIMIQRDATYPDYRPSGDR